MPASSPRRQRPNAGSPDCVRLRRTARAREQRDFARVRQEGQRLALGCPVANWNPLPEGAASRLGVDTSRRIGGAVARSRARRLLRESFRQHQYDFAKPVELVLVARNSIAGKNFAEVEKDFLVTLRRAALLKNDESSPTRPVTLDIRLIAGRFRPRWCYCLGRRAAAGSRRAVHSTRWTPFTHGRCWQLAGGQRICRCHPWGGCGHEPAPKPEIISQKSEVGINYGPDRHHRCLALCCSSGRVVCRDRKTPRSSPSRPGH